MASAFINHRMNSALPVELVFGRLIMLKKKKIMKKEKQFLPLQKQRKSPDQSECLYAVLKSGLYHLMEINNVSPILFVLK